MEQQQSKLDKIMGAIPILGTAYGIGKAIFGPSQKDYQDMQIEGQKEMTDYNYGKQIQMIGDSTKAQMQAYKDNNLNTALMYEGAGAGGTSAISPGGMPTAPIAPNAVEEGKLGLEAAATMANIDLMKSQAEKNKAEATQIAGAGTQVLTSQADYNKILTKTATESLTRQLDILAAEAMKRSAEAQIALTEEGVAKATAQDKIKTIKQGAINAGIEAIAMKQGIELDKAKINEITTSLEQKWTELDIQNAKTLYEHKDRLKILEDTLENQLWVAGIHAGGQIIGDLLSMFTRLKTAKQLIPKATHKVNEYPDGGSSTTYYK